MRSGKFGRRPPPPPPLLLLLLLRPRDRLGLGPCLIRISLEFTGFGEPVFENTSAVLPRSRASVERWWFLKIYPTIGVEPSEIFDERRTPTLEARRQNTMKFPFFIKSAL